MKKFLNLATMLFMLGITFTVYSQEKKHEGFYLSLQVGPAMGYINGNLANTASMEVSGTGYAMDILLGGAIKENLILHGILGFKSIPGPEIKFDGQSTTLSNDYSFNELIIGGGSTYYFQKNFFVTGNIGVGNFSFSSESENMTVETSNGFSYQLKAGKEWWIASRWALGAALEYGGTRTKDEMDGSEETWQSHRYGIRVTATLNGKK